MVPDGRNSLRQMDSTLLRGTGHFPYTISDGDGPEAIASRRNWSAPSQGDVQTIDGHVTGMSPVRAMDSSGPAATVRAGSRVAACSQRESELPIAGLNLLNVQTGEMGKQGADTHDADSFDAQCRRSRLYTIGTTAGRYRRISGSHNPRKSHQSGSTSVLIASTSIA